MKEPVVKIVTKDGVEHIYSVLFSFDSSNTNKSYVVYTDYSKDDFENIKVYSSSYSYNENDELLLEDITTEYERNFIEVYIKEKLAELNLK